VAVIVEDVAAVTAVVETVNVAEVAPAAILTEAGTVAADVFELVRVTTAPPDGAADESVTVPVLDKPPTTEVGESVRDESPFSICACQPLKMIGPQPESVSQPGPALETTPFGRFPFVPEVMS
jgi:hypothetical protein